MKRSWHHKMFGVQHLILSYYLEPLEIPDQMKVNWKFGNYKLTNKYTGELLGDEPASFELEEQIRLKNPAQIPDKWKDILR